MACQHNPYKLSILGVNWRATNLPFSSSKYFYSWLRLSNLVDLSFEYLSFSSKRKTTILFPSPLTFLQLPMDIWLAGFEMLEAIVSVLPSDWFSPSGWPGFSKSTVTIFSYETSVSVVFFTPVSNYISIICRKTQFKCVTILIHLLRSAFCVSRLSSVVLGGALSRLFWDEVRVTCLRRG